MSIISNLVKTLFLTSITIYGYTPNYGNHRAHNEKTINNISGGTYPTTISGWITNETTHQTPSYTKVTTPTSNKAGYISTIMNPLNTNNYFSSEQYQYLNPMQTISAAVSEQPVAVVSIESEIRHAQPLIAIQSPKRTIQITSVNYNNEIYHHRINKEASPLANNDQKYLEFIVRRQRNLKNNHNEHSDDDDGKLIEQSIVKDDGFNDLDASASLSSTNQPSSPASESDSIASHEIRYLHDIFLNYPKPHHVNVGHVELSPNLFEKRFETLKAGNRYKGEVMWLDNTGGYAQHFWDLAQGKL